MIIILCLYLVALWAVFSKFKLVRWGWLSGTVLLLIGGFILAIFLALFNYLTPSGRVTVTGRVVEVTPNVTGQIVAIPVKPNVPVKKDDVLFQIDPAPFQYKVAQLQASLAAAKQQTQILKSNYEQATANVTGLTAQLAYNRPSGWPMSRSWHLRMPTRNFRRRTSRFSTKPCRRSLARPRRRSRAPGWRWIPRSAASTRRSRRSRRNSRTQIGNCRKPRFAR